MAKKYEGLFFENRKEIFSNSIGKPIDLSPGPLRDAVAPAGELDGSGLNKIR
jgi:hypothetical protein